MMNFDTVNMLVQERAGSVKILEAIKANKSRGDLDSDRMLVLSIVKSIEIMGEAASKVTQETRETKPWQTTQTWKKSTTPKGTCSTSHAPVRGIICL
jgi:uncharacterized protein with HEPN domain